ncbi:MAG: winged helix-turn-helix transcriptional regulator [Gammaproteobacteria bacterium]|nr:winged helix-turn-helix transcriptional regulator [Gammaproteobacteria bacterium]
MNTLTRQPQGCSNFKLRQLLRGVSRHYDAELANAGIKTTQYSLLSHLVDLGPITPGDLARRMGMDASTLTRNLRVVIEQGWATQGPGRDTRSRRVEVTSAGRAKRAEAKAHWKRAQLAFNARLGVTKVAALHELLDHALTHFSTGDHADD